MLEVVNSYAWPTDGFPFASLGIRVVDLALRLGVTTKQWDVDGLGRATGFGFRAASGRVYLLEEIDLSVKHGLVNGSTVYADAGELASNGGAVLAEEMITALGLAPTEVATVAGSAAERYAAELVEKIRIANANRSV